MGGCSAINCTNHSRKGNKMFTFPAEITRRKKWIINCRREGWVPGSHVQLCSDHFEESQFEANRKDGWKKLKQTAIPTLFNIPNPPPTLGDKRIKGIGFPKPNSILSSHTDVSEQENNQQSNDALLRKIAVLEEENRGLKNALEEKNKGLSSFLSEEQIASLTKDRRSIAHWSNEAIIKALKLRFALGKHGFNYLRQTGYPIPAYSTINKRIQNIKLNFGVLKTLLPLLKTKIESMDSSDRNCCLLIDEMEISNLQDFDVSSKSFVGNVTLGKPGVANHYTVVMLRGLKSPWKQVMAHELTGASTNGPAMYKIICETIIAARSIGLKVRASTSDMGACNKAMWSTLGVSVTRNERKTSYVIENDEERIHAVADVPHLIKNMRNAFLSQIIILPQAVCDDHDLPSAHVSSGFLKQLWISEIMSTSALRSLHHLNKSHLFPNHFSRMNVATAVQLFSIKTAAALEKAVRFQQIDRDALSTAWWIRLFAQWFEIMTARHKKHAITTANRDEKLHFLKCFIDIMQEIQLGKGWKPLQTGLILSTLSVINLTKSLFSEGFTFFLPGRLTQDALENVFGQIRRKSGSKPTALQAKVALRLICISQFISDIKHSNYSSNSDCHLLDTAALNTSLSTAVQDGNVPLTDVTNARISEKGKSSLTSLTVAAEENHIYYIAGATLHAILNKKSICQPCLIAVKEATDTLEPHVPKYRTLLTEYTNMGGIQMPESGIYRICREAERGFTKYKDSLLLQEISINDSFIEDIAKNCLNVSLPTCCKLRETIITHYLIIRCKGLTKCIANKRAHEACFGSASTNKKQKKE